MEALNLDTVARPILLPVLGRALMRHNPAAPAVAVASFDVPEPCGGLKFRLTALDDGSFQLYHGRGHAPGDGQAGRGAPGDPPGPAPGMLDVQSLTGKPGQSFDLMRKPMQEAIADLRKDFNAVEKGKDTRVIGLTYKSPSQLQGAAVLNEIVRPVLRHQMEKKNGETAQTLAALQGKLPELKARLDESESRLNAFRSSTGSVDLPKEAEAVVTQSAAINSEISSLQQKRRGPAAHLPAERGRGDHRQRPDPQAPGRGRAAGGQGAAALPRDPADRGAADPGRHGQPGTLHRPPRTTSRNSS